jgi:hypothetical protein
VANAVQKVPNNVRTVVNTEHKNTDSISEEWQSISRVNFTNR